MAIRSQITTPVLANDPDVFPAFDGQKFVSQKSPTFPPTIKRRSVTGRSIRAQFGDVPWWQFKVGYDFLRDRPTLSQLELQQLYGFFATHLGGFAPFYYLDPDDNTVTNVVIGTGDGVTTTFQLGRQIAAGTVNASFEPIYVVRNTPTVTVGGTPTGAFTIGSFCSITFSSPPALGAAIAWSGQFFFLCSFSEDQMDPGKMVSGLWSLDKLPFESWMPL